jgi:hypothetical protein
MKHTGKTTALGGLLTLCVLLGACSKHYWVKRDASADEFNRKQRVCLHEATHTAYRQCMEASGWTRIKSSTTPTGGYRGYPDLHSWAFRPY